MSKKSPKKFARVVPTRTQQAQWLQAVFPDLMPGSARFGDRGNHLFGGQHAPLADAIRRFLVGNRCLRPQGDRYELTPHGRCFATDMLGIKKPKKKASHAKLDSLDAGKLISHIVDPEAPPGQHAKALIGLKRMNGNVEYAHRENLVASLVNQGYLRRHSVRDFTVTAAGIKAMKQYLILRNKRESILKKLAGAGPKTEAPVPREDLLQNLLERQKALVAADIPPVMFANLTRRIEKTRQAIEQSAPV